jgi:hypothetical protein
MSGNENEIGEPDKTRRSFLSVAGTGIVGTFGLNSIGTLPKMKRVPKYFSGGEVIEWMEVPEPWHRHNENAENALSRFNDAHFHQEQNILETGLIRSSRKFGGKNGFDIEAIYDKNNKKPTVPDSLSGIPIHLNEGDPEAMEKHACKNTGNFNQYPGGVNIYDTNSSNSPREPGTEGYRVKDGNDNDYMVTASHIFYDCGWYNGDNSYQGTNQVGEVKDGDVGADFVVTDDSAGNVNINNEIREPNGTRRFVDGSASESEIDNRVAAAFDGYTKVGVSTGKETGGLGKKNLTRGDCNDLHGEGIKGSTSGAVGDSGGPYYSVENGNAFILAHDISGSGTLGGSVDCKGERTITTKSIGMPCFWIENNTQYFVEG